MRYIKFISKYIAIAFLLFSTWLMLLIVLPYASLKSNVDFLQTKVLVYHILHWRASFYVHVFTGIFVLLAGIVQFNSYIINKYKTLHRVAGYIYIIDVLVVTGPSALVMSFYANGGMPARTSFVLLSLLWLFTTGKACYSAVKKKFIDHGNWMLRSYALTLSAITLRSYVYLMGMLHMHMRPVSMYIMVAWLSWVPNLLVAETLIRMGSIKRLFKAAF